MCFDTAYQPATSAAKKQLFNYIIPYPQSCKIFSDDSKTIEYAHNNDNG